MRAPADKRTDDEIVADIIKKAGDHSVKRLVQRLINDLRSLPPPFTGNAKDNKDAATDLRKQLKHLKRTLTRLPYPLPTAFFAPKLFYQLASLQAEGTGIGVNAQTRQLLTQELKGRAILIAELDRLSGECDRVIQHGLGVHKGVEHQKLHAAIASREVLEFVANMTGKKLSLGCRQTGPFCTIAALFFEAMSGKQDADLRRACGHVAAAAVRAKS